MAAIKILLLLVAIAEHPRLLHVEGHPVTNKDATEIPTTTETYNELTTIPNDVKNSSIELDISR